MKHILALRPSLAFIAAILLPAAELLSAATAPADAQPVVFWASDSVQPGDAVLLYGGGLSGLRTVQAWRLADDTGSPVVKAPADAEARPVYQACGESLKFRLPDDWKPGVFAVGVAGGRSVVLNRPQVWFLQPEKLLPGLVENQATAGSKVQVIGKDFLLPDESGSPVLEIRPRRGEAARVLRPDVKEKFSLRATLPGDLPPGDYELRVSNGFGGAAAWSEPLAFGIKEAETWPDKVYDVKTFGAKGDDVTDDTVPIRTALAEAERNGGGIVFFPWGTYRLTDWIVIPPKTILRGEQRDATLLKWPVDEPKTEADFAACAVYGDTSYGVEELSFVARKVNTLFQDLGCGNGVPAELKARVRQDGSRDVFFRRVAFHHWMHCSHPDRNAELWAKKYKSAPANFSNAYGSIRNFEVSDCLFQGGNQQFSNIRNARITGNSFSNGMGHCWTCLGGGAWFTVAERNELRCSSSWGYGMTGLNRIYSAHNVCHNFVQGEREAMTLDISATPATPPGPVPKGMHPIVGRNIAWFGSPAAMNGNVLRLAGIKAKDNEFAGKCVMVLDGPGAGQYREITRNTPLEFTLDRPWDVPLGADSTIGLWDLPRHMIVHRCTASDTSAFAQLYGSFYDYVVDSCTAERCQGMWGQSGWFVQMRYNEVSHAHTYHQGIGIPGPNRERNSPFGFTGLVDGNLRITKSGSTQYDSPGNQPLFVKDVVAHPVPGVRGCIIKRNRLAYNQRIVLAPGGDPNRPLGKHEFLRMTDAMIDGNLIRHSETGIQLGAVVSRVLLSRNRFENVGTPLVANPATVVEVPPAE